MLFQDQFESMFYTLGGDTTNIILIILNIVLALMLMYIFMSALKIHRYNPYRTSPYCVYSLSLTTISLFLISFQVHFSLPLIFKIWYFEFIWTAIFMNLMLAIHGFFIWRGVFIRGIIIHATQIIDAIYLIPIIMPDTLNQPFLFLHMLIGIGATIITYLIHSSQNYVPSPVRIPDELEEQVQLYIETLKSKKAAEVLEKLKLSKYQFVQEHAEKTLKLLKENKMPRSNLENNLFLLMLIDNDISIGRYRKIFYKKE